MDNTTSTGGAGTNQYGRRGSSKAQLSVPGVHTSLLAQARRHLSPKPEPGHGYEATISNWQTVDAEGGQQGMVAAVAGLSEPVQIVIEYVESDDKRSEFKLDDRRLPAFVCTMYDAEGDSLYLQDAGYAPDVEQAKQWAQRQVQHGVVQEALAARDRYLQTTRQADGEIRVAPIP